MAKIDFNQVDNNNNNNNNNLFTSNSSNNVNIFGFANGNVANNASIISNNDSKSNFFSGSTNSEQSYFKPSASFFPSLTNNSLNNSAKPLFPTGFQQKNDSSSMFGGSFSGTSSSFSNNLLNSFSFSKNSSFGQASFNLEKQNINEEDVTNLANLLNENGYINESNELLTIYKNKTLTIEKFNTYKILENKINEKLGNSRSGSTINPFSFTNKNSTPFFSSNISNNFGNNMGLNIFHTQKPEGISSFSLPFQQSSISDSSKSSNKNLFSQDVCSISSTSLLGVSDMSICREFLKKSIFNPEISKNINFLVAELQYESLPFLGEITPVS